MSRTACINSASAIGLPAGRSALRSPSRRFQPAIRHQLARRGAQKSGSMKIAARVSSDRTAPAARRSPGRTRRCPPSPSPWSASSGRPAAEFRRRQLRTFAAAPARPPWCRGSRGRPFGEENAGGARGHDGRAAADRDDRIRLQTTQLAAPLPRPPAWGCARARRGRHRRSARPWPPSAPEERALASERAPQKITARRPPSRSSSRPRYRGCRGRGRAAAAEEVLEGSASQSLWPGCRAASARTPP